MNTNPLIWLCQSVCYAKVMKAGYDFCSHEALVLAYCLRQCCGCCYYCDLDGANSRCIINSL
ncbi:hypothetical protein GHT06_009995 [Daphnia sinensis]|uniref:Uncharacterized protein n=1 Tax=Daphnia sinensis TaxID=1820382 RepID=A0AAD5KY24_9CRUS|nr:hypothetical protein GHT06_009995 [Daphnia sinensis]